MSSTPRFFVSPGNFAENRVTLPATDAHHARNVLRLRIGEAVLIMDGTGTVHEATLTEVSPAAVVAGVTNSAPSISEPRTRITVAQALPKVADKLEAVLQHGTEVGAAGFAIFGSARSVARLEDENKIGKRLERWSTIVKGAAEQSGRAILPNIAWLGSGSGIPPGLVWSAEAAFVLHEAATLPLAQALRETPDEMTNICIAVGPEGGFTDAEVAHFVEKGGRAVSLGPRILRTETAALVALSQILFSRGE